MSRNAELSKIHVGRKTLGLDEDSYRGLLKVVTGKDSAADMNPDERARVLDEMKRRGFRPRKRQREEPRGEVRKILVLWSLLAKAGVVRPDRTALNGWLIGHTFRATWGDTLTDVSFIEQGHAQHAIEALKMMCDQRGIEIERDP